MQPSFLCGLDALTLDDRTIPALNDVADCLSTAERARIDADLPQLAETARRISGHWDFAGPAMVFERWIEREDEQDRLRLKKALVARLAVQLFRIEDRMPSSVIALYPAFLQRLASFLKEGAEETYDIDYFIKDVRYALGLTVPAGTLSFDLRYRIGPKLAMRGAAAGDVGCAIDYLRWQGWGRWYNGHIDSRDPDGVSPAGWTECFKRIAPALEANPDVRGVVQVSWFYDPIVTEVSPRLAYLRSIQTENGAFLIRLGPTEQDRINATATSETRRRLVEEGRFKPTGYLIAWPRRPLIKWAQHSADKPGPAFDPPARHPTRAMSPPR